MRPYLLLMFGAPTTTETVKEAMLSDWCTWDEDYNVGIVEKIRKAGKSALIFIDDKLGQRA